MIINDNLILRDSTIESLGNLRMVGGYLDLSGTKITSLPNGLEVGGSLNLRETKITKKYILDNFPKLLEKCYW